MIVSICLLATRHFPLQATYTQSLLRYGNVKIKPVHLLLQITLYRESPIIGPGEVNNAVHFSWREYALYI